MHDHNSESLYSTDQGAVLQCRTCGRTSLFFGSVMLSQNPDGLSELKRIVDDLEPVRYPGMDYSERPYMLQTKDRQIGFAFTEEEIVELRDLLRGATTMTELGAMLKSVLNTGDDAGV